MRRLACTLALLVGLGPGSAVAQLPRVAVPGVQLPGVGPVLPEAARVVGGSLRELTAARALRIRRMLEEHRAELDRDPRGELVVRAEVVAIDITPAALDKARAAYEKAIQLEPNNTFIKQNYELFKEINDRTSRPDSQ